MNAHAWRPTPPLADGTVTCIANATSGATNDPETFVAPATAQGCYVTVTTTPCYATFNGTTPDATHGIILAKDVTHFLALGSGGLSLKVAAITSADSIVNVLWVC